MKPIYTLRAQMNLYAADADDAFAKLSEHFRRLAAGEDPDETVFCGGMLALDPAEAVPTGSLVPTELMQLIVKCNGNVAALPGNERMRARHLLVSWARHEKLMAPPEEKPDGSSKEGATAPVPVAEGADPGQRPEGASP